MNSYLELLLFRNNIALNYLNAQAFGQNLKSGHPKCAIGSGQLSVFMCVLNNNIVKIDKEAF